MTIGSDATRPVSGNARLWATAGMLVVWPLFVGLVLFLAFLAVIGCDPLTWAGCVVCAGVITLCFSERKGDRMTSRAGWGLGAGLLAGALSMLGHYWLPPNRMDGPLTILLWGVPFVTAVTTLGVLFGVWRAGRLGDLLRYLRRQALFVIGMGLAGSLAAVVLSLVFFLAAGVPLVHLGRAVVAYHLSVKADQAALQQWATSTTLTGDIPEASWPACVAELQPTWVSVSNGQVRVRFCHSRVFDFSLVIDQTGATQPTLAVHEH